MMNRESWGESRERGDERVFNCACLEAGLDLETGGGGSMRHHQAHWDDMWMGQHRDLSKLPQEVSAA